MEGAIKRAIERLLIIRIEKTTTAGSSLGMTEFGVVDELQNLNFGHRSTH